MGMCMGRPTRHHYGSHGEWAHGSSYPSRYPTTSSTYYDDHPSSAYYAGDDYDSHGHRYGGSLGAGHGYHNELRRPHSTHVYTSAHSLPHSSYRDDYY